MRRLVAPLLPLPSAQAEGGLIGGIIGGDRLKKLMAANAAYLTAARTCMAAKGYQISA